MRKIFVAGNWKMNLNLESAKTLAKGVITKQTQNISDTIDIAVCPPYVYLPAVVEVLADRAVGVGAQDVYFEANGAFTGEISVEMLKDVGCRYVILGHSERRHVIGETDELINRKLKAALAGGLEAILCIGELLSERQGNQTEAVVERQLREGLSGIRVDQMSQVTIAYEPVWAIGTGVTASPEQAQEAHAFSRGILRDMFSEEVASGIRIQYGGSVKPGNALELFRQPDVDGGLIGGASLSEDDFLAILRAGVEASV